MAIDYTKKPVPPGLDIGELSRVLGELTRELKQLRADFDEYARQTHGGIDGTARENIATLQTDLTSLTTRVSALETWRGQDEAKIDALYPTHGTSRHDGSNAVTWTQVSNQPSVFPPETHGNGAHSPAFSAESHNHDTDYAPLVHNNQNHEPNYESVDNVNNSLNAILNEVASAYNSHTHTETGTTTSGPSTSI